MSLTFRTQLSGNLNAQPLLVRGKGSIDETAGITDGEYELTSLPIGFPVELLVLMKVTGYPNASKAVGSAVNPFKGHSYSYIRTIGVPGGNMILRSDVRIADRHLDSFFTIEGAFVPPGELGKVAPIKESWSRAPTGGIGGQFTAVWRNSSGGAYSAAALTAYDVPTTDVVPKNQFRDIYLTTSKAGSIFTIHQRVELHTLPALELHGKQMEE
jgi:hypothetical protein